MLRLPSEVAESHVYAPAPAATPLARFPVFASADAEEVRAVAIEAYGAIPIDLSAFDAVPSCGNVAHLADVTLGYSRCGAAKFAFPEYDYARVQFALQGQGRVVMRGEEADVTAEYAAVTSPGQSSIINYGRDFGQLYLRIGRAALERKLAALAGVPVKGPLTFAGVARLDHAPMQGLWQLTQFVTRQLDASPGELPAPVLAELEQALVVNFLFATSHSLSRLIAGDPADAAPRNVRLAEEFIRAHCQEAISIEDLAAVSGVSARTLFAAFRRHRGTSPHQFAKRVRLERARELLAAPTVETSVSAVALACGFANLGHFARDYRLAFGELPSVALARAQVSRL
jgi:AraC-like DNA-binding protein